MNLEFAEYFKAVWDNIPEYIVSDELYDKNKDLIDSITFDFFRQYENNNFPTPSIAVGLIETFFANILKFGYR